MTTRRPRLWEVHRQRLATKRELAYYLAMSEGQLTERLPEMRRVGFPEPDPMLKLWDLAAVDTWLDQRGGLSSLTPGEQADKALERWDASK